MPRCILPVVACMLSAIQMGCGSSGQDKPTDEPGQAALAIPSTTPMRSSKIPIEVSYPIIRDEEEYNQFSKKHMVDVRLNMKVSPEVLREIALEVKANEKRQYERTFVFIYLPEQSSGVKNDPWATCHFNPTLDVNILGLTKEDEAALRSLKLDVPGTKIGAWLIDVQFVGHVAVLYEEGSRVKLADFTTGGGRFDSEMIELPSEIGRRFKKVNGSEIYAVDDSGILRMYNSDNKAFAGALPLK